MGTGACRITVHGVTGVGHEWVSTHTQKRTGWLLAPISACKQLRRHHFSHHNRTGQTKNLRPIRELSQGRWWLQKLKRPRQMQGTTHYYWRSRPEAETATGVSTQGRKTWTEIDKFLVVQYGQAFQLKSLGQRGRVLEDILPKFSQVSPPEVLPGYHSEDKNLFMLPAGNGKPSHFEIHPENFFKSLSSKETISPKPNQLGFYQV